MRVRVVVPAAALVLLAALAVPAFATTYQTDITMTNKTCTFTRTSVSTRNTMILFHVINNGTIPRGILVWGVKSKMALPQRDADLYVKFRGPGTYSYACTAGSYLHPTIIGRGVFVIRGTRIVRVVPSHGGAYSPAVA